MFWWALTTPSYDMYKDVEELLASKRGIPFTQKFTRGLPFGLKLSNGVTVGEDQDLYVNSRI